MHLSHRLLFPGAFPQSTPSRPPPPWLFVRVRFGVVSNAMAPKPYEPPFPKACQAEWRDPATAEEEGSDPTAGMTEEPDVCFEPIAEAVEE